MYVIVAPVVKNVTYQLKEVPILDAAYHYTVIDVILDQGALSPSLLLSFSPSISISLSLPSSFHFPPTLPTLPSSPTSLPPFPPFPFPPLPPSFLPSFFSSSSRTL